MKSIVQDLSDERCFLCSRTGSLDLHHIMHGTANRRWATKFGLTCWLCRQCHNSVHCDITLNKLLQKEAQKAFEKERNHEEWMKFFKKNYL